MSVEEGRSGPAGTVTADTHGGDRRRSCIEEVGSALQSLEEQVQNWPQSPPLWGPCKSRRGLGSGWEQGGPKVIGPEGCSRGDGEGGRNLGSISKLEPAGVDNKGDTGNGSVRGQSSQVRLSCSLSSFFSNWGPGTVST